MKKSLKRQYLVIAFLTCFVVFGLSYAFFLSTFVENNVSQNVVVTGSMRVEYDDGNVITSKNGMYPGEYVTKNFTVENTGNVEAYYDIYLNEVVNTFNTKSDLVYELITEDGRSITQTTCPSSNGAIATAIPIGVGQTHHYSLKVTFRETSVAQDDNMNKRFSFKVELEESDSNARGDIEVLAYTYGGEDHEVPPANDGTYKINSVNCSGATGEWNNAEWGIDLRNITGKIYCTVTFDEIIQESGDYRMLAPSLYSGLIPVTYSSDGKALVADKNETNWYDYNNHKWANAVTVNNYSKYYDTSTGDLKVDVGTEIPSSEIMFMYVWIPRYQYQLFNTQNEAVSEQMINVRFVTTAVVNDSEKAENAYQNGEWYVPNGFTFGSRELPGIWVGKFEVSHTAYTNKRPDGNLCTSSNCDATKLRMIPNANSITYQTMYSSFNFSRKIETVSAYGYNTSEIDSHQMKNSEWGLVAYFTMSKYGMYLSSDACVTSDFDVSVTLSDSTTANRCQMWTNSYRTGSAANLVYKTGCSGSSASAALEATCHEWNESGYAARGSSTGNLYGIFDLRGGNAEYVMGNGATNKETYVYTAASSSLTDPGSKYYDAYINPANSNTAFQYSHLSDAVRETMRDNNGTLKSWYGGTGAFFTGNYVWPLRGGSAYQGGTASTITSFANYLGNARDYGTFRAVITDEE